MGWSFAWVVLSLPLAYWFTAAVLAPRFTRVRELTLPAFLEARYDSKGVRGLGAVIILVATVVYVQAQIVAGGLIANIVFGVPTRWGMVGFTAILLAYTIVGGMVAVVYTDFAQLVIMVLGATIALPLAARQLDGFGGMVEYAVAANPVAFTWEGLPPSLLFTMGLAFMLGAVSTPDRLIRLYAMKDMKAIRRGVLLAIVAITVINFLVCLLGLASRALFPDLPTGDLAMPMVARAVLPTFLGGMMLAAITAAMMSTVDSLLIVAGSALSVDIYQSLINPLADERTKVRVDRIGIGLVGAAPVILLLSGVGEGELVQFIVLLFTALMASSFFMPVVGGVFWRRATKEGAAAAMIGGVTATFAWKAVGPESIDPVLPGFLISALLYAGVSLLTPPTDEEAVAPYFERGR
ncbi:MAG: hypothetical protein GWM92_04410 [Gemmatimonadetes bacterium]|nr:hypothetical protein [Gemmatimonadota bacterium]NIR77820.1 hypothetical protein [Gemmatimonadota bacterium]NIT86359.1 hypothetical protein [Gemmatimonadota bacterium]NIU30193.1 hypothetical protein [Gemmatimonadota bacterium]NIU35110.1 hypothetical protein [Gemmatimonadota bacterium]